VPAAWESYPEYALGVFVVVAAQLLLIAGLLTQRARRRYAEETIRAREASLQTSYRRIRQLAGRLINAQETARAEIARDLHDDVCQELVGVSMSLNSLRHSGGQLQDEHAQQSLSGIQRSMTHIVDGVRRLSHDLHPATLQLLGLAAALEAHCVEVEKRFDVQVSFNRENELGEVPPEIALCLFRIAQEALRNGAVHGAARRLGVSIARFREHLELRVSDDGRGFDLDAVKRDGNGLGLVSLEERAYTVGGDVSIITRPQVGTTIRIRIPVQARAGGQKGDDGVDTGIFALPAQHAAERL
jgi:two-component system sensor histidine kinase UhpB